MIHIFVGTKAQLIKMAPIMQELERRGVTYNFIDAGQHAKLTRELIHQFGLREPDVHLRQARTNITTIQQALFWVLQSLWQLFFKRSWIRQQVFGNKDGICLIHGDTLTTLLSLLYAKRCGLKVAHVEAGLRSYHLFDPFPEEIIRLIAMRFSDLLFAPSPWALDNLYKMGYRHKTVDAGGNTGLDAVRYAVQTVNGQHLVKQPYVVVTTHRVETIYSRSRLIMLVSLIERIARKRKVFFVLHEPTRHQLERFNLYDQILQNKSVEMLSLRPYLTFVELISRADFVVTDGGSIQEETYFLNVPCLIMRSKTERIEGLGENAYLAEFNIPQIERFFELLPTLRRKDKTIDTLSPSKTIVENVLSWA